jgi:hypothetical protein
MVVQYYPTSRRKGITYACVKEYTQYGKPRCWSVNGGRLDTVVRAELLCCLNPPDVESVLEAAAEVNQGYEAARRQREAELARGRYEADLAERFYRAVDPANRLSAAVLEQDWESALKKGQELERRFADQPLSPPVQVTPELLEAIRRLADDLPALWAAAATTDQDRKMLVRIFISEVCLIAVSKLAFEIEIRWVGGAVTHHSVFRPLAGGMIARELEAQGLNAKEIAAELNRRGLKTVERNGPYQAHGIYSLLTKRACLERKRSRAAGGACPTSSRARGEKGKGDVSEKGDKR